MDTNTNQSQLDVAPPFNKKKTQLAEMIHVQTVQYAYKI